MTTGTELNQLQYSARRYDHYDIHSFPTIKFKLMLTATQRTVVGINGKMVYLTARIRGKYSIAVVWYRLCLVLPCLLWFFDFISVLQQIMFILTLLFPHILLFLYISMFPSVLITSSSVPSFLVSFSLFIPFPPTSPFYTTIIMLG